MMKELLVLPLMVSLSTGCALSQQRLMVKAEHVLTAGAEHWDEKVAQEIDNCRAFDLETEAERRACIEPIADADELIVGPALVAAVMALRSYWAGVAIDESPEDLKQHVEELHRAIQDLPVEDFGGLRKMFK